VNKKFVPHKNIYGNTYLQKYSPRLSRINGIRFITLNSKSNELDSHFILTNKFLSQLETVKNQNTKREAK
jgi:hypothetical protein